MPGLFEPGGLFEKLGGADAVFIDRADRGLVRATGGDRIRFLNGMLSNDLAPLAAGQACIATLLDRKGHVLSDLFALVEGDAVLLDTAPGTVEEVFSVLEKHVIADDVELSNLGGDWDGLSFEGPGARARLEALGHPTPRLAEFEVDDASRRWLGGGAFAPWSAEGVRVLGPAGSLDGLRAAFPELAGAAAEILRVEIGAPRYGVDVGPKNFPLEARLDVAISETKGCYVGQEIIARLISRGAVNRFLVRLSTEALVTPGATIRSGATRVGAVTSAVESPASGPLALGYVRRAEAAPGTRLDVEGVPATVLETPLP
ncbi:MAG: folate-binding protein YgfZ [Deltaproteobacteria bacterium]|nr:folate-binding protein YgfZ [Deltaproteobacteria bacterium]MBW2416832.1 folate-binding protein YgfZ [Deltaproteobacteria bacterium]